MRPALAAWTALCAWLSSSACIPSPERVGPVEPEDRSCGFFEECVLVDAECACGSGGGRVAVAAARVDAIEARRGDVLCSAIESTHASC